MAKLIAFADRMSIERLCVYMDQRWSNDSDPKEMWRQIDEIMPSAC